MAALTLSTSSNTVVCQGNGLTTSFDFTFPVPLASELFVYFTNASGIQTLLSPSVYSTTGIGTADGGSVTYPLSGSPIPTGTSLTIQRVVPYQQLTSLVNQSGYYPNVVENALDYLTMQTQQLAQQAQLTLSVPLSATGNNLLLPAAPARANQIVGFDVNGNAITYPVTTSVGAGNMTDYVFNANVDFTPGTTTTLPLPQVPGSTANVFAWFDGGPQFGFTLGTGTIIFPSPIPVGISQVRVKVGTTLSTGVPATGTVIDASVSSGARLYNRIYDIPSIRDPQFGGKCDGVTDDSAAFQAAVNSVASGQIVEILVPASAMVNSNITAGAGTVCWRFAQGAVLLGSGSIPYQKSSMTYNSSPNYGERLQSWHGTTANPTTDGTVPSAYIQRVDKSVTSDDPAHLISALYVTHKRLTGGLGWLYGGYFYLEDQSNSTHAQSVACAGAFHGTISGAGWGIYGEANSHSQFCTITGGEFDAINSSGVDYPYYAANPVDPPPNGNFSCGVWTLSTGGNKNSFGIGIGAQGAATNWHVGIFMQAGSIDTIAMDIQATPPTLINFRNGASTDGTGTTAGGVGLDCGSGSFGTAGGQAAIHLRYQRLAFGAQGFITYNVSSNFLEVWSSPTTRAAHLDMTAGTWSAG